MAYEFKKLGEVESLAEVPENATVLAEVDGSIKRIPSAGLGGSGGIKTAIIKDSNYDNTLAGLAPALSDEPAVTYDCINMTFEEAYETMASGEPLAAMFMVSGEGCMVFYGNAIFVGTVAFGVPCIGLMASVAVNTTVINVAQLYWTADGISTEAPSAT